MVDTNILFPLPRALVAPVAQLQTDLTASLQDAQGLVAQIPQTDEDQIEADILDIEAAATPFINGNDATKASPALDAFFAAMAVGVIVQRPEQTATKLIMINPNLFQLAAQFLGDYSRWEDIATASGFEPPDPQPIGEFTVIIPPR